MSECRVCGSKHSTTLIAREMMFGFRDKFEYVQCGRCGSVQIGRDLPAEAMAKYYPANYYAFGDVQQNPVRRWLARQRDCNAIGQSNFLGAHLSRRKPNFLLELLHRNGVQPDHRILDVGCGSGAWLNSLASAGFSRLYGMDPFIKGDLTFTNGVSIKKGDLSEVDGTFDVITFHHSLEHVPDPVATLRAAAKCLGSGGLCLVRIPTVSSDAWEEYGADWVQLDAPRHTCVPSRKGMTIMAHMAGFAAESVIDDSYELQFYGSEQYRRDIPLRDSRSYAVNPKMAIFSLKEIRAFQERARSANARSRGDQAAFVLRRV